MIESNLVNAIASLDYCSDSFYIFDYPKFLKEINNFKTKFNDINPIFSYKTNYVKPLIKSIDQSNFLSEVVSPFEVEISKTFGINPSKIIYNGPVKDDESIEYVLKNGGIVNADNFNDLKRIFYICSKLNISSKPRVGVRFSFESMNLASRFGIETSEDNIKEILYQFQINGFKNIECLHVHFPQRDINSFRKRINLAFSLAKKIKESKININSIDIGGGFPSKMQNVMLNSLNIEDQVDLYEYAVIIKKSKEFYNIKNIPIILEPGTAIASNSFHLVGHIRSMNKKDNKVFLNTDISRTLLGGLKNHVKYPTLHIPIGIKKEGDSFLTKENKVYLVGFSCVEGDIIGADIQKIRNSKVKDKFVLSSIGSYSCVFKSPFIRGDVALFHWDGNNLALSRRAQNATDIDLLYL